jgi:hypothetical protein
MLRAGVEARARAREPPFIQGEPLRVRLAAAAAAALLLQLAAGDTTGRAPEASAEAPPNQASSPVEPCNPLGDVPWAGAGRGGPELAGLADPPPVGAAGAPFLAPAGLAPRKKAWEASVGGRGTARALIHARVAGWPTQLVVDRATLPGEDRAFLERLAQDTWRGLDALRDRESGLPLDHVRFAGSPLDLGNAEIGDYASVSSIGLYLASLVAAHELDLLGPEEALVRLRQVLDTLARLETFRGIFFNFYDTTSLERTSHFLSFVDSAWLTAGLMVVRSSFPELHEQVSRLIVQRNYGFFFDERTAQMSHGYYVDRRERSLYHYATFYTEARLGSLIAIGKGDVPEAHWYRMVRTFPEGCTWQSQAPRGRRAKEIRGIPMMGGWYEWKNLRYVPSWGGSMFEALMPTLFLDERALAPRSLGRNDEVHVEMQRRFAEEELGYPVWGMSPAVSPEPDGYREYGVPPLGVRGYGDAAVTPHAVALALAFEPEAAAATLRKLVDLYPIYGEYGLYDSVNPQTGAVGTAYLALDQSMLFLALANHLRDGVIQRRFAADPIAAAALPLLEAEDFFD